MNKKAEALILAFFSKLIWYDRQHVQHQIQFGWITKFRVTFMMEPWRKKYASSLIHMFLVSINDDNATNWYSVKAIIQVGHSVSNWLHLPSCLVWFYFLQYWSLLASLSERSSECYFKLRWNSSFCQHKKSISTKISSKNYIGFKHPGMIHQTPPYTPKNGLSLSFLGLPHSSNSYCSTHVFT